ncbi:MAG: NAD(P)-binding protein [Thermoanaerobaculia bacterium]|nr:NAD(P)-binding protein [Thermoanaerobaculia bacterium]
MSAPPPLVIAGAGPAGLAAATLLARAGRRTVVHERNATVGARFVGDLQVVEDASDRLETVPAMFARLGLPAPAWVPATTAEFFDAKMRRFEVSSKEPYAWFVTRGPGEGTLDATLLSGALAAGAEVRFGSRLEPSSADLVATGPQTPDGLARETAFETDGVTRVRVLFDPTVAPGGYAYLFTVGGRGTFGCAIVKDLGGIDRYFGKAREKLFSLDRVPVEGARDAYSFMNFALAPGPSQGGRPAAGEAGAFQDYLFGLGMRYAISSGALAAEALLEGRDFASLARERFAKRQRVSLVNRFLYETGGAFGLSLFARLAAGADFRSVLSAFYRPGPVRLALAPFVAALWRNRGRCAHRLPAHWCRRREREIRDVALGRIG